VVSVVAADSSAVATASNSASAAVRSSTISRAMISGAGRLSAIEFVSEAFDRELLYLGAPLDGIAVAVSRRTVEGDPENGWVPAEI
jgi:hypothetical protein